MWDKKGRRSRNICVSTPETELLLSTPAGLLPKQLGWSTFYLQCINSFCSPFLALFWLPVHRCNLTSPPLQNAAFICNSWIAVRQPTDALLPWNCCALENPKGRHLYLKENVLCWGYLKIPVAVRRRCFCTSIFKVEHRKAKMKGYPMLQSPWIAPSERWHGLHGLRR